MVIDAGRALLRWPAAEIDDQLVDRLARGGDVLGGCDLAYLHLDLAKVGYGDRRKKTASETTK